MKSIITAIVLLGAVACNTPREQVTTAREGVDRAEENLSETRAEAAQEVREARQEGAEDVAEAKADVRTAEVALERKLDALGADLVALEKRAVTPEDKEQVIKIRERHDKIVVKVRDHDRDGITWGEIERDVNAAVDELGRDIDSAKIKIVVDK